LVVGVFVSQSGGKESLLTPDKKEP